MAMHRGEKLNQVFDRCLFILLFLSACGLISRGISSLHGALQTMESLPACKFAHSEEYGYVTSCPTNLVCSHIEKERGSGYITYFLMQGTGMRASVHVAIPKLTKNGKDVSEAKKVTRLVYEEVSPMHRSAKNWA